ncbi:peroxiredoxin [Methanomassiliicoccus luminyensis]|jgi:peroxiredoxin Q/BCP|uniref:peroxiredoxin n=1 Tax=Methanomassiliicoccus luminyensis TaxID=1080712 RepID=UPI00037BA0F7|nr:peroxiredoxin [Methanomassiliicoccus luminyensis]
MTTLNRMLQVGDKAPGFSLQDQDGNTVDIGEMIGKKALVVYFYPKDFTAGCTLEAHEFREMHEEFQKNGAEIFGISSDDMGTHQRFREENKLPFTLLSDPGDRVRDLYGAWGAGRSPGRVTYLIDKKGVIRMVFSSVVQPKKHSHEAMRVLEEINRE